MNKAFLLAITILFSGLTQACANLNCSVTKILDSSIFEESLSIEEYPNVTIIESAFGTEVSIGENVFSEDKGDVITSGNTVGFDKSYMIAPSDWVKLGETITVMATGSPLQRTGLVLVNKKKTGESIKFAELRCK